LARCGNSQISPWKSSGAIGYFIDAANPHRKRPHSTRIT
jgi:hypothetical protein